ncbi:hypothetical protein Pla175_28030 [Pirellulimonas nuda]|uniref:PEP-CTERM protein-sorting domain-containing protein n=1 Tax=Pirellulimonas nuda TaxID=2528009 RepID=A0A518DD85_9BACT|nr:hypothetical protein [Pirellulimonas nuda]QDU89413.1 hypothetical protein Pla175_28030 [Pirellulimonas nuda]
MRLATICAAGLVVFATCVPTFASIATVDFESAVPGAKVSGDELATVGSLVAKVGSQTGSIVAGGGPAGAGDQYLYSDDGGADPQDRAVEIVFNKPISSILSLDALFQDSGGTDFTIRIPGPGPNIVVFSSNAGGLNPAWFTDVIGGPLVLPFYTTKLIFTDNDTNPVGIDNLKVEYVPEAGSLIAWSVLAGGFFGFVRLRRNARV